MALHYNQMYDYFSLIFKLKLNSLILNFYFFIIFISFFAKLKDLFSSFKNNFFLSFLLNIKIYYSCFIYYNLFNCLS